MESIIIDIKKFIILLISFFVIGCSSEHEEASLVTNKSENTSSFCGSRSLPEDNDDLIVNRLYQINDSIVGLDTLDATTYGLKEKVELAVVAAADAKGFFQGIRYGWDKGHGFEGKLANATLFGVIFSVAYSAAVAVGIALGDSYQSASIPRNVANATASVIDNYNSELVSQTIRNYRIRVAYNNIDLVEDSYLHNPILKKFKNNEISIVSNYENIFTKEQVDYINSQEIKNKFENITEEISNLNQISGNSYLRETEIFFSFFKRCQSN